MKAYLDFIDFSTETRAAWGAFVSERLGGNAGWGARTARFFGRKSIVEPGGSRTRVNQSLADCPNH